MKTLKLVGLQTFISPFTKLKPIRNGETVTVEDALAERLLEGHEHSRDRGRIDHWMVIPDVAAADNVEATTEAVGQAPSETEDSGADPKPAEPVPSPAPAELVVKAATKGQRVARKPASK